MSNKENQSELDVEEMKARLPNFPAPDFVHTYAADRFIRQIADMFSFKLGSVEDHVRKDDDSLRCMYAQLAVRSLAYTDYLEGRVRELEAERDHPETEDFFKGVPLEAAHQRGRWPSEHDAGKSPADWFWLVGYLAGKCLASHIAGNREKALHHTISTAAALANWHLAIKGETNMRPGIETPTEANHE